MSLLKTSVTQRYISFGSWGRHYSRPTWEEKHNSKKKRFHHSLFDNFSRHCCVKHFRLFTNEIVLLKWKSAHRCCSCFFICLVTLPVMLLLYRRLLDPLVHSIFIVLIPLPSANRGESVSVCGVRSWVTVVWSSAGWSTLLCILQGCALMWAGECGVRSNMELYVLVFPEQIFSDFVIWAWEGIQGGELCWKDLTAPWV